MSSWWNENIANNLSRTWIGATYNSWFGRNTTHIRNDSGKKLAVVITSKAESISEINANKDGNVGVKLKPNKEVIESKGLIPPGAKMPFERTHAVDYLTIGIINDDGSVTQTATDVKIWANNSYRIDKHGIPWTLPYDKV